MAKYYIQSGTVRTVISADDSEKAALWVIHRAMQQVLPIYEEAELAPAQKAEATLAGGMLVLGDKIFASEIGFDHAAAEELDTFQLVDHWHKLMVALSRLEGMLK